MTDAQKKVLSEMEIIADSLVFMDFGGVDLMLDKVVEIGNEAPQYDIFANRLAHGIIVHVQSQRACQYGSFQQVRQG